MATGYAYIARHGVLNHDLDTREGIESLIQLPASNWRNLSEDLGQLYRLVQIPLEVFGCSYRLDAGDPDLLKWLRVSAEATLAAGRLAQPGAEPFWLDLGLGEPVRVCPGSRPLITPIEVGQAIYLALILRDPALIRGLCELDLNCLRPSGVTFAEWTVDWARTLSGLAGGADWTFETFRRALEGADPNQYEEGSVSWSWCANVANPEMNLFFALTQDAEQFNEALFGALEAHRFYYGEAEFDPPEWLKNDPLGFFALGPTALACAAHDKGWPILVRSDYLPEGLIFRA